MCAAVINCIYTAITESNRNDIKNSTDYNYKDKVKAIIKLSNDLMRIMSMNMCPEQYFGSKYNGLETVVDASSFHDIKRSIIDVENAIDDQITIKIDTEASTSSEIMQFVPDFNKNKILIKQV
jgi:hypothetical protein